MATTDVTLLGSAGQTFKTGFTTFAASYSWILWLFVVLAVVIFIGVLVRTLVMKKKQWTHVLRFKVVLQNNLLGKEQTIRMRRFPLIKRAEVFELEKPLLGGYLMPELDSYTGMNEFSIIIDTNNRIYTNKGEYFCPDKSSVNVSAKHAEIDIARSDLRADYQNINQVQKRIEWAQVAKFAMIGLLIIAVMVVAIKGIGQWGENKEADAQKATAEAQTWVVIANVMKDLEGNTNANILLADKLKELYGTRNLQSTINNARNETL